MISSYLNIFAKVRVHSTTLNESYLGVQGILRLSASLSIYTDNGRSLDLEVVITKPKIFYEGESFKTPGDEELDEAARDMIKLVRFAQVWDRANGIEHTLAEKLTYYNNYDYKALNSIWVQVQEWFNQPEPIDEPEPAPAEKAEAAQQLINQLADEEPASAYALSIDSRTGLAH
jgi:hypothetical protein